MTRSENTKERIGEVIVGTVMVLLSPVILAFGIGTWWDDNDSSTWTWQIDHIVPHAKLPYTKMTDNNFHRCWSLENLRPLSAKRNLFKSDKLEIE
jgi:hypothetical protein